MRVTLIHNPGAGAGGTADDVERVVRAAGHTVRVVSMDAGDWTSGLAGGADLVAVSGGDGTVGRVAKRMAGRGVPIAALAAGTANNIAFTLGVEALSLAEQIDAWRNAKRFPVDLLIATGPWGREPLIEGLGLGLLASSIRRIDEGESSPRDNPPAQRLADSLQVLKERVGAFETTHVQATIDGRDISGDYVLFEAMNTQFVGPNLFLAPDGHAGDGMMDAVYAGNGDRERLREHLAKWQRGALRSAPPLDSARGRELTIAWTGFGVHLDDRLWPDEAVPLRDGATIDVRVEPHAVEFLVP